MSSTLSDSFSPAISVRSLIGLTFLTLTTLGSSLSLAGDIRSSKQEKTEHLIALMRIDQATNIGAKACVNETTTGPFSPEKVLAKDGRYYGLTPKSPVWPDVLAAFQRYADAACSYMSPAEMKKMYVDFYVSHVSEKDLDNILKFMSGPSGRSFLQVQDEFVRVMNVEFQKKGQAAGVIAQDALYKELSILAAREAKNRQAPWWKFW